MTQMQLDLGIAADGLIEAHEIEKESTFGEFVKWPSTPRWHKGLTITEKIDGTNACVVVDMAKGEVKAQSRKRRITPDDDNAGFARWVYENAGALMDVLGHGYHYGEWFGPGIQKNPLGVEEKRFALFHALKYTPENGYDLEQVDNLETVPVLFHGQANVLTIADVVEDLEFYGTKVKGARLVKEGYAHDPDEYAQAEGIIVFHKETQQKYKILLEGDAFHKWEVK